MADWSPEDTWGNGPISKPVNDVWNGGGDSADWPGANTNAEDGFDESTPINEPPKVGAQERAERNGGCFNCGEEGHNKADCTKPKVERPFQGTCRVCDEEGHRASDCPKKPKFCRNCHAENDHDTADCKGKKVVDDTHVPVVSEQEAWNLLQQASTERDIDDFKAAIKMLAKSMKYEITELQLEEQLRRRKMNFFLIGLKKEVAKGYTNVSLSRDIGKAYTLGIFRSANCPKPILKEQWPDNAADNLARLTDVGLPLESGLTVCSNCGEVGHGRKACTQEREIVEAVKISCVLCGNDNHRMRDCPEERPSRERKARTFRHCESEDHIAKDCPSAPKQECRNCGELGHRKAECTNERVPKCRNCDAYGHMSRECPEAKDWSHVTCRHCGENGHNSDKRCDPEKKAAHQAAHTAQAEDMDNDGFNNDAAPGQGDSQWQVPANDFNSEPAEWENVAAPAVAAGGAW